MVEDDEDKLTPGIDPGPDPAAEPTPDPEPDRPRACKDAWVWRKPEPWKKGVSGNPKGINGSTYRNRAAIAAEGLFDGEVEQLSRRCIELALAGDPQMMRLCVERLLPPRRVRPIKFKLPELRTIADAQNALASLVEGVSRGEVLSDEALAVTDIVNSFVKVFELSEFEARLIALEKANAPPEVRFNA